jgi:hypothetical protein
MTSLRVYLESGKTWVFAGALDWPGWSRRGKGEAAALQALLDYQDRYAAVVGPGLSVGPTEVAGRVEGGMMPDFGAPGARGPWDEEPIDQAELDRFAGVLEACWSAFDRSRASASAVLRKGPRGGGRDRDQIAEHVRESERSYSRKLGLSLAPATPWEAQRTEIAKVPRAGTTDGSWPVRYSTRRCAWHVLDHAWEMEDKTI